MKYIYTLVLFTIHFMAMAGGGCTIDSTNVNFFNPSPDTMACVERNKQYDQIIQIYVPGDFDLQTIAPNLPFPVPVTIDSLVITNVNGLPTGLSSYLNPSSGVLYGDSWACVQLLGTTNDTTGRYTLNLSGFISLSNLPIFPGVNANPDTTLSLATVQSINPTSFSLFVDVIEQGDQCRVGTAVPQIAESVSSLHVYPNPAKDQLIATWASSAKEGVMALSNAFGQVVYQQNYSGAGFHQQQIATDGLAAGVYTLGVNNTLGSSYKKVIIK